MSDRACRRHHARRVKARVRQIARVITNNSQDRLESLDRGRDYLGHCSPCQGRNPRGAEGSLTVQERRSTNIRNWEGEYEDAPRLLRFPNIAGEEDLEMAFVKAEEETKASINVDLLLAELRLYAAEKPFCSNRWQRGDNDVSGFTDPTAVLLRISRRRNAAPVVLQAIRAGADVNACDEDTGNTALMKAVASANVEVSRILLENGADPNARNKKGETALMAAVKCCSRDENTVRLLIEKGADLNLPDGTGSSPLHIAARRGDGELVDVLLTAGAASWIANSRGMMPIDLALYKKTRTRIARAMRARIRAQQA